MIRAPRWLKTKFLRLSPFLRGVSEALLVNGLGLFAALAAQSVLAQVLGPADFGIYSACVSAAAVLSVIAIGGMDTALLRELPSNPHHTFYLVRRAERGLVIGLVLGLPVLFLWLGSFSQAFATVMLALFLATSTIRQFALRANFVVFWGRFPDIVMRPVLVAAFISFFAVIMPLKPLSALVLHSAATALVFLFGAALLKSKMRKLAPKPAPNSITAITLKDRSLWLALSLLTLLMLEIDKLVGSTLMSANDFGHYALASRLYGFGVVATESLAVVAAPFAARFIAAGRTTEVIKIERDLSLVLAGVALLIFSALSFFGSHLVAFLAPGFDDSVAILKILALAALAAPFILPRLAITSVLNPALAWRLQSFALLGLVSTSILGTIFWHVLGQENSAQGLAVGIVAGAFFRAILWRVFGKLV